MIFNSLIKPKATLTTLPETATLDEALTVLEDTGYRCVPVLDKSGKIFRGNIYKMHLYRHKARNGDMHLPVTALLKNATKFISINAAFFSIFFAIRDLPYIAVLDNNNQFYGILTHNNGSYVLTVITPDERGALVTAAKEITRFCQIVNVISLDPKDETMKRVLYTLPADVTKEKMERIVKRLEKKGLEVSEIEDLHQSY